MSAEDLVAELDRRGLLQSAELAGLQRHIVIALAERLKPDDDLDFEQAIVELKRAVKIALDVIARGAQGSNEGAFVDAVLAQVAEKTRNEDLDGAAQTLETALIELDRQEAEQREATIRKRTIFLEAAIKQHTLRRDAVAVVSQLERLVDIDRSADRPAWLPQFREQYQKYLQDGQAQGISFSLLVAIECSRRMGATARDSDERGNAD
ncbi:hypothetical protein, partial [Labrys miyagiensis]|uniref:hypothetical protein n=1 Tax=Labrys miyagiensis TaxID=346912 RepID=UPI0024E1171E